MAEIETVEVTTGEGDADASVIWLHGLGADGHDFEPIVAELKLPEHLSIRFVFPHAPRRPVTINGGVSMRAWYDIVSLDRGGAADEQGILQSVTTLDALIDREQSRGVERRRIVAAGFSQGGAIALTGALGRQDRLGGLMALSTYLPLPQRLRNAQPKPMLGSLPIFMAHGQFDPMLPITLGRESADFLQQLGLTVEWHEYPMAHAVCAEEIADIRQWLLRLFDHVE